MKFILPLFTVLPTFAAADISMTFTEGAPKDRFVIENQSCDLSQVDIEIDLSTAPAGLIFDVTAAGEGVEVFQPVEIETGFVEIPEITDGAQLLVLRLGNFARGDSLTITADLDDTVADSSLGQIRIDDSEIVGVTFAVTTPDGRASSVTDATGVSVVTPLFACPLA